MSQDDGTNRLDWSYSAGGKLIGFKLNSTDCYYYLYNLQGDVTGIYNADGVIVAKYYYDGWGNTTEMDGSGATNISDDHIANLNPIRYRSYYYDSEILMYYLQSRYYMPALYRFISADALFIAGDPITGANMYAYCGNNPVMYFDPSGMNMAYVLAGVALGSSAFIGLALFALVGFVLLPMVTVGQVYVPFNEMLDAVVNGLGGLANALVFGKVLVDSFELSAINAVKDAIINFAKKTGKEKASDVPGWARHYPVDPNSSADDNARRMLDDKYGKGNWPKGPGSEYSKIKKWLSRSKDLLALPDDD